MERIYSSHMLVGQGKSLRPGSSWEQTLILVKDCLWTIILSKLEKEAVHSQSYFQIFCMVVAKGIKSVPKIFSPRIHIPGEPLLLKELAKRMLDLLFIDTYFLHQPLHLH